MWKLDIWFFLTDWSKQCRQIWGKATVEAFLEVKGGLIVILKRSQHFVWKVPFPKGGREDDTISKIEGVISVKIKNTENCTAATFLSPLKRGSIYWVLLHQRVDKQ